QPHFNVLLKDDKKYPYLCITWSDKYPRMFITRKRRLGSSRDRYYGPYTDAYSLRSTLRLVKRLFPLRQRRRPLHKDRPCLNYDIGRCPGVCQDLITPEQYRATLNRVAMIFQGRTDELLVELERQMTAAAEELNFELAAQLRDRIKGLHHLGEDKKVSLPDDRVSRDAIALAADRERACVQLFQVRAGRLTGRLGFVAQMPGAKDVPKSAEPIDAAALLTEVAGNSGQDEGTYKTGPKEANAIVPAQLSSYMAGKAKSRVRDSGEGSYSVEDSADEKSVNKKSAETEAVTNSQDGATVATIPTDETLLGSVIQRAVEEHYSTVDPVEIPAEVVVQYPLPDQEWLQDWLSRRRGRKVTVTVPQRQTKAEFVQMVERNAEFELKRLQRLADRDRSALQDLTEILDLPDQPRWIECYDISHIQGSDAVASRVVFVDGVPAKQHYRRYKIRNPKVTAGHSDDFASMAEVIQRRFKSGQLRPVANVAMDVLHGGDGAGGRRSSKRSAAGQDWPDLVVIDGGKGQLSAVMTVLGKMEIADDLRVISLAKREEEIFLPGESKSLKTDREQPGVQLLRRLRDEAHRFAVSFHRQKRTERMRRSHLDAIPGLGHRRQKDLLAHFRSVDYIREATTKQLCEVDGIGPKMAKQIYEYFHPSNTDDAE
ncbi:MAG: excinuclease ABC subunit UvrC, partial [Cyanobacteria bacterium P01_F01_bin.153]